MKIGRQRIEVVMNSDRKYSMKQTTFIVLHGWGLSQERFQPLIQELQKRHYDVVSLDFPGFGKSETPLQSMTLDDYAHFLYEWLQEKKIKNPVFIGHSFGGRVSLRFNSLYPSYIQALVLTGTPGFRPVKSSKFLLFVAIGKIGKLLLSLPFLSGFHDIIKNKYYYIIGAREYTKAQGVMKQTFKNIVTDQLIDDMKNVNIPTYLIWGGDDKIVPVRIAEKMKQIIRGSVLTIIPNTDHGVPYKAPILFADQFQKYFS